MDHWTILQKDGCSSTTVILNRALSSNTYIIKSGQYATKPPNQAVFALVLFYNFLLAVPNYFMSTKKGGNLFMTT